MKKMMHILTFRVVLIFSLILQAGFLTAEGEAESAVPLKKVTLFSSGVGYFERDGYIEGNSSMELTFDVSQINDILKSMVVRDFNGGTIDRIDYSPQEPLNRALKSFIIDLSGNPGLPAILNQARGESVRVTTSGPITGKVIGVEELTEYTDNGENTQYSLNLLTADGIVSIDLKDIKDILFLNPVLKEDLKKSLSLIARENRRNKKRVVLHFSGTGKRRISIGYLTGVPVWKTSYRIVLGEGNKHFLQGWAIVENTTDEDWEDVNLSLISGQPISFTMDLYKPVYIRRQRVKLDLQRQVESQVYEDNLEYPSEEAPGAKSKKSARQRAAARKDTGAGSRILSSSESAAEYRDEGLRMNLSQGVRASARGRSAGEFFEYSVKMPVTIKRQQSAMIPIINTDIRGGRVSIYNEKVDPVNPLNGIKLKNTTGMYLTAGPVTVFEKGIYAGDSRIKTLAPGAERLISYSIDLDTEVKADRTSVPDTLVSVKIVHGTLISKSRRINEITYIIKNSGRRKKNVLIEQPVRAGWKLVEPAKPYEKTRNYYRFMVSIGAGEKKAGFKKLKVTEEKILSRSVILSNINNKLIEIYIKAGNISAGVKEALKEVSNRMNELTLIYNEINRLKENYEQIRNDQTRIRKNMARLSKNSGLYKRYVDKLTKQEDEVTAILEKMDGLQVKWEKQRSGLNAYISSLDL
ncbi:MAG: DUF4139 domain-containing protein [Spirochaetes bacterium]|nr:DUF4139 domain-containing protein [Spirochaetota bacterium]